MCVQPIDKEMSGMTVTEVEATTVVSAPVFAEVKSGELRAALQATLLSAGKDAMLPVLCAVQVVVSANAVVFTSTDRFRATEVTVPIIGGPREGSEWSALLGRADVAMLVKAIPLRPESHEVTSLTFDAPEGRYPSVSVQVHYGASYVLRPVEGQYPSVARLFPEGEPNSEGPHVFSVDPSFLADLCKMPRERNEALTVSFHGKAPMWCASWSVGAAEFRHLLMSRRPLS